MNENLFFVMLNLMDGGITPLIDENENGIDVVCLYPTEAVAEEAAMSTGLGATYGFEVFERTV